MEKSIDLRSSKAAWEVLALIPMPSPPLSVHRLICCQLIEANTLVLKMTSTTLLKNIRI